MPVVAGIARRGRGSAAASNMPLQRTVGRGRPPAAERQGVRRATNPDWSSDLDESVRGGGAYSRSVDLGATIAASTKARRRRTEEEDLQKSVSVAVEQAVAADGDAAATLV